MNAKIRTLSAACLLALLGLLASLGGARAASQTVAFSGWFSTVWGDGAAGQTAQSYFLTADGGQVTRLLVSESALQAAGGALALNNRWVSVQGQWAAGVQSVGSPAGLQVSAISPTPAQAGSLTVSGSKPFVSIMCKFSDISAEPKNQAFFQSMYGSAKPGLDHYWRELSFNTLNIVGSNAYGWYVLPHPEIYYNPTDTSGGTDLDKLATDCLGVADPVVNFAPYSGINMMFNSDFDNGWAWGGTQWKALDGPSKSWSVTWEPPWGYASISVIAHEMGHGFGLPHSSGSYGSTYDNAWDVMSQDRYNCAASTDPTYGCMAQHTISYHKDLLGWIPSAQRYTLAPGASATITLEQLALPATSNYLMAKIPIQGSSTHFYTVEARRKVGYDIKVAGNAVILHEVDTSRQRPAYVIDVDGNGVTSDAGAQWLVGETFTDTANGIAVSVLSATATGFQVYIQNGLYTVSGNAGVAGAVLSYTDGSPKTASADAAGLYSFKVPSGWSGTVTPSKANYLFTPSSRTYTGVAADKPGENYTAAPAVVTISGSAGVPGAVLAYTDGTPKTATADGAGLYSFQVPNGWSGTVTPSKTGYAFTPPSRSYASLAADKPGEGYTAAPITYTISGSAGAPGAVLSYFDGVAKTATADEAGLYTVKVSYNWSGTVTPFKLGYAFTPLSRSYAAVLADKPGEDYSPAAQPPLIISGSAGAEGVVLSYNDGAPQTATSDASGLYTFEVPYGWSGAVTPALAGFTFDPTFRTYTLLTASQPDQDYAPVPLNTLNNRLFIPLILK